MLYASKQDRPHSETEAPALRFKLQNNPTSPASRSACASMDAAAWAPAFRGQDRRWRAPMPKRCAADCAAAAVDVCRLPSMRCNAVRAVNSPLSGAATAASCSFLPARLLLPRPSGARFLQDTPVHSVGECCTAAHPALHSGHNSSKPVLQNPCAAWRSPCRARSPAQQYPLVHSS